MNGDDALRRLLSALAAKAPNSLAFPDAERPWAAADHPLAAEVAAALKGKAASLPVDAQGRITWVTFAPNFNALRNAIEDLRAGIIPGMAWELTPALATATTANGALARAILAVSPQGYFRWECQPSAVGEVADRLALLRHVSTSRPPREDGPVPSLAQLRQRFLIALAIGEREGAEAAVEAIDTHQLDTAVNTLAMRVRLCEAFGLHEDIVRNPQLASLLSVRMPRRVVEAVLRAHHAVHLLPAEAAASFDEVAALYDAHLHDLLGPAIAALGETTDPVLQRLRSYQARTVGEAGSNRPTPDAASEPAQDDRPCPSQSVIDFRGWSDFAPSLRADDLASADAFLARMPTLWGEDTAASATACAHALLECFTDTDIIGHPTRAAVAERALMEVIDNRVCSTGFPAREFLPLYAGLLDCWSLARGKSAHAADGQFLLSIAQAVLVLDSGREQLVARMVRAWWQARPIRARLAWLLEALDMLTEFGGPPDLVDLWYAGAELAATEGDAVSRGERRLWSRLGVRFGLTAVAVNSILGATPALVEEDPLQKASIRRVAIVSLRERAAETAAEEIRQRSGAHVQVVTEHVAGAATRAAADADVVLMVWSASKHAVYRAFDKVRDRLEYVQGTGASSIVLALERWVARGRAF
jgi:hypothetical protein